MANTVDFSKMNEYIAREGDKLLVEASTQARSLDYVNVLLGVKHKMAIPYLSSEVVLDEADCNWSPDGADYFGERTIEVHTVAVEKEFCWTSFKPYVTNLEMRFAAGLESMPWEEKIAKANVDATKAELEKAIWQGNSGASITGWLADAAEASATTVEFNSGQTIVDKVDAMVAAIPVKMLNREGGVVIFMSETDFRNYILQLNSVCCANRPVQDSAVSSLLYAGDSRIRLVGVAGLEGTDKMVASTQYGLVYGTDIEDSESRFEWFEDKKNLTFDLRIMFNAGTAILLPTEVIVGA